MEGPVKYALVAVSAATEAFDAEYSYEMDPEITAAAKIGARVLVPFGRANKRVIGFITDILDTCGNNGTVKTVIRLVDEEVLVNDEQLRLIRYLKENTFCTYYKAFSAIVPAGFGYIYKKHYSLVNSMYESDLTDEERELIAAVKDCNGQRQIDELLDHTGNKKKKELVHSLIEKGVLECSDDLKRRSADSDMKMIRLSDEYLSSGGGHTLTAKQKLVADLLGDCGCVSLKEACYMTGCTPTLIKNLSNKGVVAIYKTEVLRNAIGEVTQRVSPEDVALSDEQQAAFEGILEKINSGKAGASLLHGVTGSGKTAVFIRLIDAVVKAGKSVLMLVPEISLTPQMLRKFKMYFGEGIAVIHSSLSQGQRMDEYKRIMRGDVSIVIGTRSAVFSPVKNLGLIIMDEEGESTYKSDNTPRYHAREVAIQRCGFNNAQLLLASATPSLESYYYAKNGRFSLFELNKRFNEYPLPQVRIIDMQSEAEDGNDGLISFALADRIKENLKNGEQSILLLNRRGFNTYVSCTKCKKPVECPNCSCALTYHKKNGRLMCHICGYSMPLPSVCPECGNEKLRMGGVGTQKIEAELSGIFPDARILRMDADTASSRLAYEEKFSDFEAGKYDIMLGTQMIAKGLDFPNVTCVGVISLDKALFAGDFRSYERTFSLITQVVGRGGRGVKPGVAFIQTFVPDHYVIDLASRQDYKEFYEQEIALRRALIYPPFCDICVIGFASMLESSAVKASGCFITLLQDYLRDNRGEINFLRVFGPSPCSLERIGGKYRYRIILKCKNNNNFRKMMKTLLAQFYKIQEFKNVKIYADINGDIGH